MASKEVELWSKRHTETTRTCFKTLEEARTAQGILERLSGAPCPLVRSWKGAGRGIRYEFHLLRTCGDKIGRG